MSQPVGTETEIKQTPRLVTDTGSTLHFHRLWIDENGWVSGVVEEEDKIVRRYPPHRVVRVVEAL